MNDLRRGGRSPLRAGAAEAGSASLLVALWVVVLVVVAAAGLLVAQALAARSRADAAADLGALAGASLVLTGPQEACRVARQIVSANGASLTSCAVRGADVRVEVVTAVPLALGWVIEGRHVQVRSRARAELVAGEPDPGGRPTSG